MNKTYYTSPINYIRLLFLLGLTDGLKSYLQELEELRVLDEQQKDLALFSNDIDPDKYREPLNNYLNPLLFFANIFEHINSILPVSIAKNRSGFYTVPEIKAAQQDDITLRTSFDSSNTTQP